MNERIIRFTFFLILITFLIITSAYAQTTCETSNCKIKITIKIAFSGATDAQIRDWKRDIEKTWNGDGQVTGDCKCPVSFKVETMKITNPAQVNCNPPPAGYHCIMVTPFATNPPTDTSGNTYVGYMYPPGVSQNGQSLCGWWSDVMNRPAPGGGIYHDAAHEAGHMLGLGDQEGDGLMTNTSGDKAKPTQANIDSAVGNVCGADACPDKCCCGNGVVEPDKGESCDPMATPSGCGTGNACCPVCCSCYEPKCNPNKDHYTTQEECENACRSALKRCYQNYRTGCWDCVKLNVYQHKPCYTESKIKKCDHINYYELLQKLIGYDFSGMPLVCDIFRNEWINLYIEDDGSFSGITVDARVVEVNNVLFQDPTMNAFTDTATIDAIAAGDITVEQALQEGRITFQKL